MTNEQLAKAHNEGKEAYKKNMFALLGKPGFEDMKAELEKRLER